MSPEKLIQAFGYGLMAAAIELGGAEPRQKAVAKRRKQRPKATQHSPQTLWDQMPPVEPAAISVEVPPISDDVLARIDGELEAARRSEPPPGFYMPGQTEIKTWT